MKPFDPHLRNLRNASLACSALGLLACLLWLSPFVGGSVVSLANVLLGAHATSGPLAGAGVPAVRVLFSSTVVVPLVVATALAWACRKRAPLVLGPLALSLSSLTAVAGWLFGVWALQAAFATVFHE